MRRPDDDVYLALKEGMKDIKARTGAFSLVSDKQTASQRRSPNDGSIFVHSLSHC